MKAILPQDKQTITALLDQELHYAGNFTLTRLGGLTNHSYKVTLPDTAYVIRIPGEGTEEMIDRSNEQVSTNLACSLEIDAKLLYFSENGTKITESIPNAVTMSAETLQESEHLQQVADIYKKLHGCGVDTHIPFEVFDTAATYEHIIIQNKVPLFTNYETVKETVMQIKDQVDTACHPVKAPCHNDPLCENWITSNERMYLVDWEYAGMNDPFWDVADVSIEANLNSNQETTLLTHYLDATPTTWDMKRFIANKIYVDYLWSLWAKTRVPFDGEPMEAWAQERYTRLLTNMQAYHTYK